MPLPLSYSFRNLWTRRLTTILTALGMALVVFVFSATLMLADGLQKTLVATGSPDNIIVIRKGAQSEVQSGIDRLQASIIEGLPEIAPGIDGRPLVAKELVVLINLPKRDTLKPANVVIRGSDSASLALRPQIRLIEGRMPRAGSSEILAGVSISRRFKGAGIGEVLYFAMRDWRVVGIIDGGSTGFSSEIWGDCDQLMQSFRRPVYSSVLFRIKDMSAAQTVKERLENNPQLTVESKPETRYYLDQSEVMAKFLRILGLSLTVIFSLGAVIGAMITMYAAVANRVTEIGTLRALGFGRRSIMFSFVVESIFLGCIGGVAGVSAASLLQFITISTMNWQSFAELAFSFSLSLPIVVKSMLFSVLMGLVGGLLPAFRASRMKIVDALRAV